ncbi:dienelactone hydrolase family protein [Chryseobacterium sp. PBS4-4]|uniref:Dienelactone hydrolase family protein n=1 Tax=Chryseobacterium edaphi TaxID=2976532 RepID=A0ABT2W859_9FLAO|nr:dienelactone hydrolase family protein [Chryseobacterium edaphi]MCU7618164.1 dienelactone hydrolase family protein [Chryseobacterium edaphi]
MKISTWKVFSILFLVFINHMNAQKLEKKYEIDSLIYLHKSYNTKNHIINFLEVTMPFVKEKKDLIFFLQGSYPSPLISEDDNGKFLLLPFNLKEISKENIFVIISKPKIPVYTHFKDLDDNFQFDDEKTLSNYMKLNTLDYLSNEVNFLITKYSKDKRIKNIYVIGHSQGGRVAANIRKKKIKKIAILSVNLLGRYEESVNQLRYQEISKQDSSFQNEIEKEYTSFSELKNNYKFKDTYEDLSLKSYKTFTFPSIINEIEKIKIPTLIAYGTNDIGVSFTNDIMRLRLIEENKENFNFKVYPLLNHNFEKTNNITKENESQWQKVLEETILWLKN